MTYKQVAPYVWLNPNAGGRDIQQLEVLRSRIPKDMFREICVDVDDALTQYGPLDNHDNEETRSRFIAAVSETSASFRAINSNKKLDIQQDCVLVPECYDK